jgi:hypothetical protein
MKGEKVTIYTTSEFMGNVVKYEGFLVGHGRRRYAQYPDAPFVEFIPKGKRKPVRIQKAYNPYLIILAGWGGDNPEPEPMCPPEGGMSKYASFDIGWRNDFDVRLAWALEHRTIAILADYRHNQMVNA